MPRCSRFETEPRTANHEYAACDSSLTHCSSAFALASYGGQVVVVGKTTVCRIFNCKRATKPCGWPGALPLDQPSKLTIRCAPFQARPDESSKSLSAFALSRFGGTAFARASLVCLAEARFAWLVQARRLRAKAGEYRARTGDLLVANQALSQLS